MTLVQEDTLYEDEEGIYDAHGLTFIKARDLKIGMTLIQREKPRKKNDGKLQKYHERKIKYKHKIQNIEYCSKYRDNVHVDRKYCFNDPNANVEVGEL